MKNIAINILMLTGLYGCSSKGPAKLPDPCPTTLILRDLAGQSLEDLKTGKIQAFIELDAIRPECVYEGNQAYLTPYPQFTAMRKEVKTSLSITANYFIALADSEGKIVEKRVFPLHFEFEKDRLSCYERPSETVNFSFKKSNVTRYKVFIGLEIEDADILKNRRRYQSRP